jgi:hypothetical protein
MSEAPCATVHFRPTVDSLADVIALAATALRRPCAGDTDGNSSVPSGDDGFVYSPFYTTADVTADARVNATANGTPRFVTRGGSAVERLQDLPAKVFTLFDQPADSGKR